MSVRKNRDRTSVQSVAKRARKSISLDTKMSVIRRMEAGETRPTVCHALNLAPATVSTIMANAKKIKESVQKTTKFCATYVSYSRSSTMEKMEHLLSLWMYDLNQQQIPLTQSCIASKAKTLFGEIQQKEGGNETFAASKGWFARFKKRSQIYNVKITGDITKLEPVNVEPEDMTELLQNHAQSLSNEELEELAHNLTEQQKDQKDENERETAIKRMKTNDLQDILATIDNATQKLCDIDPDWERSSTVKKDINAILCPYYEILQQTKKKCKLFQIKEINPGLISEK